MQLGAARLAAYSRLFSAAVVRELATRGRSPLFARLVQQSLLLDRISGPRSVGDAFQAAFDVLRVGLHRDEYIYRAALTEKVLLGKHSLRTASMLTEFRVADCKADVAILNGTATVYEIKSERDSLARLSKQLDAYGKFFAKVCVIAGENHVASVLECTPPHVGVLALSRRHQISVEREGEDRVDAICPLTVFDSIRVEEAKAILRELGRPVPAVPNTLIRTELRKEFAQLEPATVHRAMVRTLKASRDLAPLECFVQALPNSLQAAALSTTLKASERRRLIEVVGTPFDEALRWA